ncbi:hypothetical protein SAMN04487894_1381, partial [Niabella drilacis]
MKGGLTVKFSTFVLLSSPSPFFLAEKRKLANKNGFGLRCAKAEHLNFYFPPI